MKKIFKTSALFVSCALAFAPAMAQADDFAELRNSKANMTKQEAKETEAGMGQAYVLYYGVAAPAVAAATPHVQRFVSSPNFGGTVTNMGKAVKGAYDYAFGTQTLYKVPKKAPNNIQRQKR